MAAYRLNHKNPAILADLSQTQGVDLLSPYGIEAGKVDLVVGGPPCQGFSIQRIGEDHDSRNSLVLEFIRLVAETKPKLFIMENVPGLLGKRGLPLLRAATEAAYLAGYEVDHVVADAADYGIPQHRRRVFYFGWPAGSRRFTFPEPSHEPAEYVSVMDAIGDLPSPPLDHTPPPGDPLHGRSRLSALNQRRIELIPPGGGMQDLPDEMRVTCHKGGAARIGHRYVYGRLDPDAPAATITARFDSFTRGKFGHPTEPRNITLREGARLQTFPDDYIFVGTREQIAALIGNAVPPLMAHRVAAAAAAYLRAEEGDATQPTKLRLWDVTAARWGD